MNVLDRDHARSLDERDPLKPFREQFWVPKTTSGDDAIYLTGNSLGLQPKSTAGFYQEELEAWKTWGVEGHFKAKRPWVDYQNVGRETLASIVGGERSEVVMMNSLSANLHFLLASFYRPTQTRHKILVEPHAFPSDMYVVKSQIAWHGYDPTESLLIAPMSPDGIGVDMPALMKLLDAEGETIATVMMGGVNYYTGEVFDMKAITAKAQAHGCLVGFDLAHGAGNVPLKLHDWGVDFAAWCTYKYLNAGPGAVGAAFVHERHHGDEALFKLKGWWGNAPSTRFQMRPDFEAAGGIDDWQLSNVPVMGSAGLLASLEIFKEATLPALHKKGQELKRYMAECLKAHAEKMVEIITPLEEGRSGCQLSLVAKQRGRSIFEGLTQAGIFADWREPDVIRVAPVPLYNSFEDVRRFVETLTALEA